MERKILAAGNWKMNKTPSEAAAFITELKEKIKGAKNDVLVCPPYVAIPAVVELTKGTNICVGAENLYYEEKGAYTGEIAANMLTDLGVTHVIIGHSERREYFGETDDIVNKKVLTALEHKLVPVLCVGESLQQREDGVTFDLIRSQVKIAFRNVSADVAADVVIAYEPIWAIGTGKTATVEQAQEVCGEIRACIRGIYGDAVADKIRILYGGSVTAANAKELFAQPDIDGGLVGGASLKADDFTTIANA